MFLDICNLDHLHGFSIIALTAILVTNYELESDIVYVTIDFYGNSEVLMLILLFKVERLIDCTLIEMEKTGRQKTPQDTTIKQRHTQQSTNGDVTDKGELLDTMHHERLEREKIVLWRKPIKTIHYSCLGTASLLNQACKRSVY